MDGPAPEPGDCRAEVLAALRAGREPVRHGRDADWVAVSESQAWIVSRPIPRGACCVFVPGTGYLHMALTCAEAEARSCLRQAVEYAVSAAAVYWPGRAPQILRICGATLVGHQERLRPFSGIIIPHALFGTAAEVASRTHGLVYDAEGDVFATRLARILSAPHVAQSDLIPPVVIQQYGEPREYLSDPHAPWPWHIPLQLLEETDPVTTKEAFTCGWQLFKASAKFIRRTLQNCAEDLDPSPAAFSYEIVEELLLRPHWLDSSLIPWAVAAAAAETRRERAAAVILAVADARTRFASALPPPLEFRRCQAPPAKDSAGWSKALELWAEGMGWIIWSTGLSDLADALAEGDARDLELGLTDS